MNFWPSTCQQHLVPLKHACRMNPEVLAESTDPDFEMEYIDIGNVSLEHGIGQLQAFRFSDAPSRARKIVRKGDTLISTVRTYLKAIAYVQEEHTNWIASTGFAILRPDACIDPRFLYRVTQASPFVEAVVASSTGVSYPAINPSALASIEIPLPDLDTQKAIVGFLGHEIARIDQLIEKKQRIIERFGQKLESLVHDGIIASSTENVRFGFTASRVYRPVDLKSGASFVRLGLYNRGRGVFKKPEADEEDMGDSSFFWVEPGDLILSGQFAWEGAVALASAGESGCVVSHRYPVYSGTKHATTAYLLAFFRTKMGDFILNEASRGSAGRNRPLNVNRLEKEKIPIPSATLQARIGEIVSLEMEIRRKIQTSIDLLQEHRSALITAAVTGQIDVATWGKRGTSDRRLDAIEADMTAAAQPERQPVRA